tara:strand:- start:392 stop:1063 length:672 start_codon:yes stop_codon:yes gene_type:complete
MIKNILNLGDAALYCDFGNQVNKEVNSLVINYFKNIKNSKISGITNIAPSYNKIIITFDLNITNYHKIEEQLKKIEVNKHLKENNEIIEIPVCCEEEFTLDVNRLETRLKLPFGKILEIFFSTEYFCYMTGFIAGMPFLGDIDNKLRTGRLETPRVRVPEGSVGITEQFANIYTFESPGGWNIIGNSPIKIFDKYNNKKPSLINPGDSVKFYKITKKEFNKWK